MYIGNNSLEELLAKVATALEIKHATLSIHTDGALHRGEVNFFSQIDKVEACAKELGIPFEKLDGCDQENNKTHFGLFAFDTVCDQEIRLTVDGKTSILGTCNCEEVCVVILAYPANGFNCISWRKQDSGNGFEMKVYVLHSLTVKTPKPSAVQAFLN